MRRSEGGAERKNTKIQNTKSSFRSARMSQQEHVDLRGLAGIVVVVASWGPSRRKAVRALLTA